jgi:5'-nucleotidase
VSHPFPRRRASARLAALIAIGLTSFGLVATGAPAASAAPSAPERHKNRYVDVQLLSINDFHGYLEPPQGSSGRVVVDEKGTTVDAGGAEYLATHVKRLRAEREQRHSVMLSTGDNIGASPLLSALFRDEPTIEFLNSLRTFASATGNHEYDEGIDELQRLQHGGCHPTDGCFDEDGYAGARFIYLSANVRDEKTGRLVMPAYAVKRLERNVSIGFIGVPLKETPSIVTAAGVAGLRFEDEVAATNRAVRQLKRRGVESIVCCCTRATAPRSPRCRTTATPCRARLGRSPRRWTPRSTRSSPATRTSSTPAW